MGEKLVSRSKKCRILDYYSNMCRSLANGVLNLRTTQAAGHCSREYYLVTLKQPFKTLWLLYVPPRLTISSLHFTHELHFVFRIFLI